MKDDIERRTLQHNLPAWLPRRTRQPRPAPIPSMGGPTTTRLISGTAGAPSGTVLVDAHGVKVTILDAPVPGTDKFDSRRFMGPQEVVGETGMALAVLHELAPDVLDVLHRHVVIEVHTGGRLTVHVPAALRVDPRGLAIIDIDAPNAPLSLADADASRRAARVLNCPAIVVTPPDLGSDRQRETMRMMADDGDAFFDCDEVHTVMRALARAPELTISELCVLLGGGYRGLRIVHAMIIIRLLEIDLSREITNRTRVRLNTFGRAAW